jgi:putative hemolysin
MIEQIETDRIFSLDIKFEEPIQKMLFSMVKNPIEHVLAFPRLNKAYADIAHMTDNRPFPDKALEQLNVSYDLDKEDLARLQKATGPVIVVANHPFGGIEGIILASVLRPALRRKVAANSLLNCIPEMRDLLIPVNPKGIQRSERIGTNQDCIQWVRNGGMLVVFLAGEVSPLMSERRDYRSGMGRRSPHHQKTAPRFSRCFTGTTARPSTWPVWSHPLHGNAPNELPNRSGRTFA